MFFGISVLVFRVSGFEGKRGIPTISFVPPFGRGQMFF